MEDRRVGPTVVFHGPLHVPLIRRMHRLVAAVVGSALFVVGVVCVLPFGILSFVGALRLIH